MTKCELAWAAGLLEGEGSIRKRFSGKRRKSDGLASVTPSITIGSTDYDVLKRFQKTVGGGALSGPYREKLPNRKPFWQWTATWRQARRLAPLFYPYMGHRRKAQFRKTFTRRELHGVD